MFNGVKSPCSGNILIFFLISKFHQRILSVLMVCALLVAFPCIAVDDDYLKALESEADDTGSVTQNTPNNPKNTGDVQNNVKENFEKLLEFELPSTYKFYTKLSPADQNKVIKHYNNEKKMSAASKLIFDLYFESNK